MDSQSKNIVQDWTNSDQIEKEFQALQGTGSETINASFQNCLFQSSILVESTFKNCVFEDCVFKNCDLSLSKWIACSFVNVTFINAKLIGIDWTKASIPFSLDVIFDQSILSNAIFFGLNLQNIQITHCLAREVNFEEANLTSAKLIGTDFTKSRFRHTNLSKADFSQAKNYTIDHKYNTIKSATFELPEAVSLLDGLGILLNNKIG